MSFNIHIMELDRPVGTDLKVCPEMMDRPEGLSLRFIGGLSRRLWSSRLDRPEGLSLLRFIGGLSLRLRLLYIFFSLYILLAPLYRGMGRGRRQEDIKGKENI